MLVFKAMKPLKNLCMAYSLFPRGSLNHVSFSSCLPSVAQHLVHVGCCVLARDYDTWHKHHCLLVTDVSYWMVAVWSHLQTCTQVLLKCDIRYWRKELSPGTLWSGFVHHWLEQSWRSDRCIHPLIVTVRNKCVSYGYDSSMSHANM
jgi:hypothetical protein